MPRAQTWSRAPRSPRRVGVNTTERSQVVPRASVPPSGQPLTSAGTAEKSSGWPSVRRQASPWAGRSPRLAMWMMAGADGWPRSTSPSPCSTGSAASPSVSRVRTSRSPTVRSENEGARWDRAADRQAFAGSS